MHRSSRPDGFLNEPAAQHPRPIFWHPQVELPTISAVLSASLRCVALMEVTIVHLAGRPQAAPSLAWSGPPATGYIAGRFTSAGTGLGRQADHLRQIGRAHV